MKIALITIHNASNYGAVLQTFATQHILQRYGDVAVIDYTNSTLSNSMRLIRRVECPRDILSAAKDLLRIVPRASLLRKFTSFTKKNYRLLHTTEDKLIHLEAQFDKFISGSDQIWNPRVTTKGHGFDKNFFLSFVTKKTKISYASSLGDYPLSSEEKEEIKNLLRSYSYISTRESDRASELQEITGYPVQTVLDPTLLLTKEEWTDALKTKPEMGDYILVYRLQKSRLFDETVKAIQRKTKKNIIVIDQGIKIPKLKTTVINDAGPLEFINLFSGADYVITNSFHGVAFSINFEIPFIVPSPPVGRNRISRLLEKLELKEREIFTKEQIDKAIESDISFEAAKAILEKERETSINFLNGSLTPP